MSGTPPLATTAAAGQPAPSARVIGERQVELGLLRADLLVPPEVRRVHVRVEREREYSEVRGWRKDGDGFVGTFSVNGQGFWGRATARRDGTFECLVHEPPHAFRRHPCVHRRGGAWFYVHQYQSGRESLSGCIASIESLLSAYVPGVAHA